MPTAITQQAITRARKLRHGMTDGERRLWSELRQFRRWYGIHVRRQAPIGSYIADFVVHDHKLVVEVDGERHLNPERQIRDRERDNWLAGQGYKVLRFSTGELAVAFDGCVQEILWALGLMEDRSAPPISASPPRGEEGRVRVRAPTGQAGHD